MRETLIRRRSTHSRYTPHSGCKAAAVTDIKGYASMQMVGAGFTFFSTLFTSFISCLLGALSALSMAYIVWATVATIVFAPLFILQENYSELIIEAVDQYNSTYCALVHKWLFVPLQVSLARCPYVNACECL